MKSAIKQLLKNDPSLKPLFKRHSPLKFEPQMQRSPFESLVRAIAHQQLHGKAAETILQRMVDLFAPKKFPTPEDLQKIHANKLRACGFSQSKVKSIKDIAEKTISGVVPTKVKIKRMSNAEIIEQLTSIFGVGKWTVEMLLIFQLGRMDIWPVDDFGVRNGYRLWKKLKEIPSAKDLKDADNLWAPYQTLVALHLWREADFAKKS